MRVSHHLPRVDGLPSPAVLRGSVSPGTRLDGGERFAAGDLYLRVARARLVCHRRRDLRRSDEPARG